MAWKKCSRACLLVSLAAELEARVRRGIDRVTAPLFSRARRCSWGSVRGQA
jgi:hypothetical protein